MGIGEVTFALNELTITPQKKGRRDYITTPVAGFNATSSLKGSLNLQTREAIEEHLEQKVSQIFTLFVLCYGTWGRFSLGPTVHQGYSEKAIPGVGAVHGAHSANLPHVYAEFWPYSNEVSFLPLSGFYLESNRTDGLIAAVNTADLRVDQKLRDKAIALVNQCAAFELAPEEGVRQFVKHLEEEIDAALERQVGLVKSVLAIYKEKMADISCSVCNKIVIDRWLNLQIDSFDKQSLEGRINDLAVVVRNTKLKEPPISYIPNLMSFHSFFLKHILLHFEGDKKVLGKAERAIGKKLGDLRIEVAAARYDKDSPYTPDLDDYKEEVDRLNRFYQNS